MPRTNTIHTASKRSPGLFFLLASILITPLLILEVFVPEQIISGVPLAGLGIVCPALAACILSYREGGWPLVKALLKRAFDFRKITDKRWYIPILLTLPVMTIISLAILHISGADVPNFHIALLPLLSLCAGLFIGALCEELGWSGYATEPLQGRWGELKTALIIGLFWAIYHYVALLHVDRSIEWIAWWTVYTVAARFIMVRLFNRTGRSVFAMILFHMMLNVTWQLYPVDGSSFDPRITGLLLAIFAILFIFFTDKKRSRAL